MAKQHTLGKKERLKSRKQTEQLFKSGQRFTCPSFRVFFSYHSFSDISLQAGFGASSRIFKTAVGRNRIKRLTKEAYRVQKQIFQDKLLEQNRMMNVFFIYTGKELPVYDEIFKSIRIALARLVDINDKKN